MTNPNQPELNINVWLRRSFNKAFLYGVAQGGDIDVANKALDQLVRQTAALIQQVSDQRVREFAAAVEKQSYVLTDDAAAEELDLPIEPIVLISDLKATLAHYLSHNQGAATPNKEQDNAQ